MYGFRMTHFNSNDSSDFDWFKNATLITKKCVVTCLNFVPKF